MDLMFHLIIGLKKIKPFFGIHLVKTQNCIKME